MQLKTSFSMSQQEIDEWVDIIWASRIANLRHGVYTMYREWEQDNLDNQDRCNENGTWARQDGRKLQEDMANLALKALNARRPQYGEHTSPEVFDRYYRRYAQGFFEAGYSYQPGRGIVVAMPSKK